mgnify:FL=1
MKKTFCLFLVIVVFGVSLSCTSLQSFAADKGNNCRLTLGFNTGNDICAVYSKGIKPELTENGELKLLSQGDYDSRVVFPIELSADEKYVFSIKYRVDVPSNSYGSHLQLYVGNDGTYCGYTGDDTRTVKKVFSYAAIKDTEFTELSGTFTVDSAMISGDCNLLSLRWKSYTNQTLYIDSISVRRIAEEGTVQFDNSAGVLNSYSKGTKPYIEAKKLIFSSQNGTDSLVALPIKVLPNLRYRYSVNYKVDKKTAAQTAVHMQLFAGTDSGNCAYSESAVFKKIFSYSTLSNTEYQVISGEFDTTNVSSEDKYFSLRFKSYSGQLLYIDSVTIEVVRGDLNADGKFSAADLVIMRKILLGTDEEITVAADINNDGDINICDLVHLKRLNSDLRGTHNKLSVNGISIENYIINCDDSPQGMVYRGCEELQAAIKNACDKELPVINGFDNDYKYRIIVRESGDDLSAYSVTSTNTDNLVIEGGHGYSVNAALHTVSEKISSLKTDESLDFKTETDFSGTYSSATENTDGYRLVFSDEFNRESLGSVWTQNSYEKIENKLSVRNDAAYTKDGYLRVESKKIILSDGSDGYSGGEMYRNDMTFAFGYFEIRAKLPRGAGSQTAFWMKQTLDRSNEKSAAAEIDVFETFGSDKQIISCFHSWWNKGKLIEGLKATKSQIADGHIQHLTYNSPDLNGGMHYSIPFKAGQSSAADDWHTYGCEWTPEYIKYYCDGYNYATVDIRKSEFDSNGNKISEYLLFQSGSEVRFYFSNMITAHKLVTPADENTEIPSVFYVDYIHLYQKANGKLTKLK